MTALPTIGRKAERSFSDEVLRLLGQLESAKFEEVFRAAWMRMAPPQDVKEQLPDAPKARSLFRQCFSKALAELADPHFDPKGLAGSRAERVACAAAHETTTAPRFVGKVVLVCGGREYDDEATLDAALSATHSKLGIALLVQGGQQRKKGSRTVGADWLAKQWAMKRGIQTCTFDANWDSLGRPAGPRRNEAMTHFLSIDVGVAFPGGTGTEGMSAILEAKGITVWRVPKGWRPS
jgi:hypothetical protein